MAARREVKYCDYCYRMHKPQNSHTTDEHKCGVCGGTGHFPGQHCRKCRTLDCKECVKRGSVYLTNPRETKQVSMFAQRRIETKQVSALAPRRRDYKSQLRSVLTTGAVINPRCPECGEAHDIKKHLCQLCWNTGHGESTHNCKYCLLPHGTEEHKCRLCFDSKYIGHSDHRIDAEACKTLIKVTLDRENIIPPLVDIILVCVGKIDIHEICSWCEKLYYWERRAEHEGMKCEKCKQCGHLAKDCWPRVYGN